MTGDLAPRLGSLRKGLFASGDFTLSLALSALSLV